ncbi:aminomethyl-transferring glycine dehydrogenase subunit GcvPA [Listeria costaricensis]|uniref:aminomethyl-transferring glycine dehydrogenase subunit GcvPA n=1 Tax=Listeria costaricensis TaxID=2026604 RepID=UPI000C07BAE7|nr:aminomethyl-transferring glycine dehydrogenase subunit GcvPA [Listeria costaricensis]
MAKYRYLPMTEADEKAMLDVIGVQSVEELFCDIPESIRFKREYDLKPAKSEPNLLRELAQLAAQNVNTLENASFLGAGVYNHYIPTIVDHVISRSEFYTAYTPYQPEISQGELQAIFEFQTMIAELTGMELANSSMYDGGTALAEGAMLAAGHTKRKKILVSETVHPESISVLKTYAAGQHIEVELIPETDGVTNQEKLKAALNEEVAAVVLQYPNFYGQVEPLADLETFIHENKSLLVVSSNPLALGVLTPPGSLGADVVTGDTQVFGIPESFGGPHCGYFAVSKKLMRKVPGRLVGETVDENGKRGYVLTLQAREQHIRRDKATSNICSNQALNALASSVAMVALGRNGLSEMAKQNIDKSHYAKKRFLEKGFDVLFSDAFFNEFVIRLREPVAKVNEELVKDGFIGGLDLSVYSEKYQQHMLVCVTEMRTKEEIDAFVDRLEGVK